MFSQIRCIYIYGGDGGHWSFWLNQILLLLLFVEQIYETASKLWFIKRRDEKNFENEISFNFWLIWQIDEWMNDRMGNWTKKHTHTYNERVNVMRRENPSEYFYLNNKLTYIANRMEFGCNDKEQPQQPHTNNK